MAASQAEIDQFVKLLQAKKIEQARPYIDKIDSQDPDAIASCIIGKGLQKCLVKKQTTPLGMTSALYFYKQLFTRCQFDFMQNQQQFEPKIHRFVYDTCLYSLKGDPENPGLNYFKDTMNLDLAPDIKSMGNTLVLLALELMKCMGQWYAIDYFNQEASIFALYYNKLKEKKVVFPDRKDFVVIRDADERKFKASYQKWTKRMDELYGEEPPAEEKKEGKNQAPTPKPQEPKPVQLATKPAEQKKPVQPPPKPAQQKKPPQEKPVQSKVKQSEVKSSPNQELSPKKKEENSQQFLKIKKDEIKSIIPDSGRASSTGHGAEKLASKLGDEAKGAQANRNRETLEKGKVEVQPQPKKPTQSTVKQSQASNKELPKPPPVKVQPPAQPKPKPSNPQPLKTCSPQKKPQFILDLPARSPVPDTQEQRLSSSRIQRKAEVPFQPPKQSVSPHLVYGKEELAKLNAQIKDEKEDELRKSYIQAAKKSMPKTEKFKPINNYEGQGTPFNKLSEPETVTYNRYNREEETVTYPGNRNQQQVVTYVTSRRENDEKRPVRKMNKTEKPGGRDQNQNFRKSIPKTEKKTQIAELLYGEFEKSSPNRAKTQNQFKTLSDFRNIKIKRRLGNNEQINYEPSEPILRIIEKSGLGQKLIPFLPEYFEPVNLRMQALLLESLRIGFSSAMQPSKPFFKKSKIALRLIKSQGSYMISIHNLSNESINIGYSQALQAKHGDEFSCKIKIKGLQRAKVEDVTAWRIQPMEFADIPFDFYTSDPNFKFLEIVLAVDSKIVNFILPITLLDQGKVSPCINLEQIASYINLYGRIMKSSPILLSLRDPHQHYLDLPPFFRKSENKESSIKGYMLYSIKRGDRIIKINIFVKESHYNPDLYEIHAIYDNRIEENEDFAKVLLELLCLLLNKHH